MLDKIFEAFLITSAAGTALTLALLALKPVTKKVFSPKWNYYIWLGVLIVTVMPVKFNLLEKRIFLPEPTVLNAFYGEKEPDYSSELTNANDNAVKPSFYEYVPETWAAAASGLFIKTIVCYMMFRKRAISNSYSVHCDRLKSYTDKDIEVRKSNAIGSPFVMGVIRPIIVLPDTDFTEERLDNILRHETVHLRRRDNLYRWFAQTVKCINWFNPTAYLVFRQVINEGEIACDAAVVSGMSEEEKTGYINTILTLISERNKYVSPLTTGMTGSFKRLKRRFIMIKEERKVGRRTKALSCMTAAVMLASAVFAGGVAAAEKDGGFTENGTVYAPLRSTVSVMDKNTGTQSRIDWNNGIIEISKTYGNDSYVYIIEIDSTALITKSVNGELHNTIVFMKNSPVLKDGVTYVPDTYIEYMYGGIDGCETPENDLKFVSPVTGEVSAQFGERHNGLDIAVPMGTEVKAAADGTVVSAEYKTDKGNYVVLSHKDGSSTVYTHGSELLVKAGDNVKAGDVIMKAGSSGMATGPHLHFEVIKDGKNVDPKEYL